MFRKILIANRGEIALRIIRTCKKLRVKTVAVYSDADIDSLHVSMADEAYSIGAGPPAESYLNIEHVVKAAKKARVEAVHPGYGFLAENPDFAKACEEEHVIFIGPSARVLGKIANKFEAKKEAIEAGVDPIPGSRHELVTGEDAEAEAKRVGYPVLLKATYGGGGRGLRLAKKNSEVKKAFDIASSEARTAFGRSNLYLEKYLESPRHIEVQVLAGRRRRLVHLGERECSLQRRHQKILEETPSPALTGKKRLEVLNKALKLGRATGYENAGTFEFVMSKTGEFYYLETNKRIQVEHLITEMVTGIDIVEEQMRIASGDGFNLSQDEIHFNGAALDCRINAEDPDHSFAPSPGRVATFVPPSGPGIRVDTALYDGSSIPQYYDSLIAKIAALGRTRREAINRMQIALQETLIEGVKTTILLQQSIIENEDFAKGKFSTQWLDTYLNGWNSQTTLSREEAALLFVAINRKRSTARIPENVQSRVNNWRLSRPVESLRPALFAEV